MESSFSKARFMVLTILVSALTTVVTVYVMRIGEPSLVADIPEHSRAEHGGTHTSLPTTVPDVVAKTIPSVVSVVIRADVPVIERYFEEYNPWGGFFGGFGGLHIPRERQIGTEKKTVGGGTGFFVSEDGYIITNKHVVDQDGVEFSILTNDGATYPIEVVAKDPTLDVAVLKVKDATTTFPALTFGNSDTLRLGEEVIAIGNALAEFPNSVSVGVVSGLARNIVARDSFGTPEALDGVIQTDAAINPGNSGGPLLNAYGEVVGVNVAVANGSENIGFALPIAVVREVFQDVKEFGEIVRPYIGVRFLEVTKEVAEENNLPYDYGVLVVRGDTRTDLAVRPGSPADKAGIEENDIILEIEGVKLDEHVNFAEKIRTYSVGDTVKLRVYHDGDEKVISVTLEKAPTD